MFTRSSNVVVLGAARSGWVTIWPVGTAVVEATTTVRSALASASVVSLAATSRSNASRQSTPETFA